MQWYPYHAVWSPGGSTTHDNSPSFLHVIYALISQTVIVILHLQVVIVIMQLQVSTVILLLQVIIVILQ